MEVARFTLKPLPIIDWINDEQKNNCVLTIHATLERRRWDKHKIPLDLLHTTKYYIMLYLGSWIREIRLNNRVLIVSEDVLMKGIVDLLYITKHLRLPNHHMFPHVIDRYGFVPDTRIIGETNYPTRNPLKLAIQFVCKVMAIILPWLRCNIVIPPIREQPFP